MQMITVLSLLISDEIKKQTESAYETQVTCNRIAKPYIGLFHVGQTRHHKVYYCNVYPISKTDLPELARS